MYYYYQNLNLLYTTLSLSLSLPLPLSIVIVILVTGVGVGVGVGSTVPQQVREIRFQGDSKHSSTHMDKDMASDNNINEKRPLGE